MKDTVDRGTSDIRDAGAGRAPLFECVVGTSVVAAVAVQAAAAVPGVVRVEPGLVGLVGSVVRAARQRIKGLDPAPIEGARVEFDPVGGGPNGAHTKGSHTKGGHTNGGHTNGGHTVRVEVDVVISGQDQAAAVGRAVQRAVAGAVTKATGVAVSQVSVSIIDIVWDMDRR
ncbi:MAG: hypothetical protein ABW215_09435 [Kibdelosporangium sp.]